MRGAVRGLMIEPRAQVGLDRSRHPAFCRHFGDAADPQQYAGGRQHHARGVEDGSINGSMKGDTFTRSDPDRDDINYLSTK